MNLITVYAAFETVDEYGRIGALHGIFTSEAKANEVASGIGWYGGKGKVESRKALKDGGEVYLIDPVYSKPLTLNVDLVQETQNLKQQAMNKLTPAEQKLLGLQ